jgi:hypothetical protein
VVWRQLRRWQENEPPRKFSITTATTIALSLIAYFFTFFQATRACIDAINSGSINNTQFRTDELFGFEVPLALPGVDSKILNPRDTWTDKEKFDATAKRLAKMFRRNYARYQQAGVTDYSSFGPRPFAGIDDFSDLSK